jgi:hypothetical protein
MTMANKNARIPWAVMTRDEGFDAKHISVKPHAKKTVKELIDAVLPASTQKMTACPGQGRKAH